MCMQQWLLTQNHKMSLQIMIVFKTISGSYFFIYACHKAILHLQNTNLMMGVSPLKSDMHQKHVRAFWHKVVTSCLIVSVMADILLSQLIFWHPICIHTCTHVALNLHPSNVHRLETPERLTVVVMKVYKNLFNGAGWSP